MTLQACGASVDDVLLSNVQSFRFWTHFITSDKWDFQLSGDNFRVIGEINLFEIKYLKPHKLFVSKGEEKSATCYVVFHLYYCTFSTFIGLTVFLLAAWNFYIITRCKFNPNCLVSSFR